MNRFIACGAIALLAFAPSASAATIFVFDVTDPSPVLVGSVQTIDTAEDAVTHANVSSLSVNPSGVPLGPTNANLYVHQNTINGDRAFGFAIGQDVPGSTGNYTITATVTDATNDPVLLLSEDGGDFIESPDNTFINSGGSSPYTNNSDGMVLGTLEGPWTVTFDVTQFSNVNLFQVASGDGSHLVIDQSRDYALSVIPEPATLALLGLGGAMLLRRRR